MELLLGGWTRGVQGRHIITPPMKLWQILFRDVHQAANDERGKGARKAFHEIQVGVWRELIDESVGKLADARFEAGNALSRHGSGERATQPGMDRRINKQQIRHIGEWALPHEFDD